MTVWVKFHIRLVQAKPCKELRATFTSLLSDTPAIHTAGAVSTQKSWMALQTASDHRSSTWQLMHQPLAHMARSTNESNSPDLTNNPKDLCLRLQRKRNSTRRTFKPEPCWWLFTKALYLPQTLVLSFPEASCLPLTWTVSISEGSVHQEKIWSSSSFINQLMACQAMTFKGNDTNA